MRTQPDPAAEPDPAAASALEVLQKFIRLYEIASPRLCDLFAEDASLFLPAEPLRLEGRAAAHCLVDTPAAKKWRSMHALHPRIRLLGRHAALLTYHARTRENYSFVDRQATLLLVREDEGPAWKVAHLHLSPLPCPPPAAAGDLVEEILAERV